MKKLKLSLLLFSIFSIFTCLDTTISQEMFDKLAGENTNIDISVKNFPPSDNIIETYTDNKIFLSPLLEIDNNNVFHIIVTERDGTDPYTYNIYHYFYNGSKWLKNLIISDGYTSKNGIAKDSTGNIYFSFINDKTSEVFYAHQINNTSWNIVQIPSASADAYTSLTLDNNDKIHLLYGNYTSSLHYTTNKTGSFINTQIDTSTNGPHDIITDDLDNVHIFYNSWSLRDGSYRNSLDWGSKITISNYSVDCSPDFSVQKYNNKLYAVHSYVTDGSYNYSNLYISNNFDGTWQTTTIQSNIDRIGSHQLLMDDPSNIYIFSTDKKYDLVFNLFKGGIWNNYILVNGNSQGHLAVKKHSNIIYIVYTNLGLKTLELKTIDINSY